MAAAEINEKLKELQILDSSLPLDYSFQKFKELKVLAVQIGPRSSRIGKVPEIGSKHHKYLTKSIWVNHNKLSSIKNMDVFVDSVMEYPEKLEWIDFSFNYILDIDECIQKYPNLKIIYFHGNLISDINEISKLRTLKKLRSITFHGNPISNNDEYRLSVIAILPQLVTLDFFRITREEAIKPKPAFILKKVKEYNKERNKEVELKELEKDQKEAQNESKRKGSFNVKEKDLSNDETTEEPLVICT